MNQRRTLVVLAHVACWSLFLFLPRLISVDALLTQQTAAGPTAWRESATSALLIGLFYANAYYLVVRYYFSRRYVEYALVVVLAYAVVAVFPLVFVPHDGAGWLYDASRSLCRFLFVFFVSFALAVNNRWKQTEKERFNAQVSSLKLQIDPHFLFNTLNSIYMLALKKSDSTAEAVVRLSEMMRYVTAEAHSDFVLLDKEIAYVKGFVELQKLRAGNTADVRYTATGNPAGKIIVPLLLIPFVENAFKYGISPEEPSFVRIAIDMSENTLTMRVENSKVNMPRGNESSTGVGLTNARDRLKLLYPGKHTLEVKDGPDTFAVRLTISTA